ncbi:MAG TPA: glycosyltransferase family 2 protein [Ktedonobacterales bacterium]
MREFEPSETELAQQRAWTSSARPLISVVTPVYNTPLPILRATIESVISQTYAHWELCLVDGASTLPGVGELLTEVAAAEPRIRIKTLDHNRGIAGNTTEAVRMATGEYALFLDHDDTLAPNALFEVARAILDDPQVDIIYFDEDKLTADGRRRLDPFFKPDWSPEMLLSANYLMHAVLRRDVFAQVGGFDPAAEGTQDWDLMLRCTERTQAIRHIPKVLYHWRMMPGSTAAEFTAKPYVFENQLRCVANHLQRQGVREAQASFPRLGVLRVSWPTRHPQVSIIIPTKDNVKLVRPCLDSIRTRTSYHQFEIILVDTGSRDRDTLAYYDELAGDERVRIVQYTKPFNYSAANNFGAQHATGDLVLFLNNDIEVLEPDWLEELVRWAERPEIGIVGAKLLYPSGLIQHAGVVIGMEGHASHIFWGSREDTGGIFGSVEWYRNYLAVTGACMIMRRQVFDEIGGFDEDYQLVFSDVEICLRAVEKGYRNVYCPFARLTHHEGGSRGQRMPPADLVRGYGHMRRLVEAGDPSFNPNLSYASRIPVLARKAEERRLDRLSRMSGMPEGSGAALADRRA